MIIHECAQGTAEWHKARAGVITASMFSEVRKRVGGLTDQQKLYVDFVKGGKESKEAALLAGYKTAPRAAAVDAALNGEIPGDFSEGAKAYSFRVAIERISGEPLDEGFQTWAMRRGNELEEDCRILHESDIGMLVDLAGFVTTDDCVFGCSADSLIGEDGGGEYKCFINPDKLRSIVINDDWSDVIDQVQGSLWLTGRKWWDMCLYCPALEKANKHFIRKRIARDEEYIYQLESDLVEFSRLVDSDYKKLLEKRAA